jgi:hypothetical protein
MTDARRAGRSSGSGRRAAASERERRLCFVLVAPHVPPPSNSNVTFYALCWRARTRRACVLQHALCGVPGLRPPARLRCTHCGIVVVRRRRRLVASFFFVATSCSLCGAGCQRRPRSPDVYAVISSCSVAQAARRAKRHSAPKCRCLPPSGSLVPTLFRTSPYRARCPSRKKTNRLRRLCCATPPLFARRLCYFVRTDAANSHDLERARAVRCARKRYKRYAQKQRGSAVRHT